MTVERPVAFRRKALFQFDFHFKPKPVFRLARINIIDTFTNTSVSGWDEKKGGDINPASYSHMVESADDVKDLFFQFMDGIIIEVLGKELHHYSCEQKSLLSFDEESQEIASPAVQLGNSAKPAFKPGDLSFSEM
jgi:hypothetical protein